MREIFGPPLRAAAPTAFLAGCLLVLLDPPSLDGLGEPAGDPLGAARSRSSTAWLTTPLTGEEMPEHEFRRLVDRSDLLATLPPPE